MYKFQTWKNTKIYKNQSLTLLAKTWNNSTLPEGFGGFVVCRNKGIFLCHCSFCFVLFAIHQRKFRLHICIFQLCASRKTLTCKYRGWWSLICQLNKQNKKRFCLHKRWRPVQKGRPACPCYVLYHLQHPLVCVCVCAVSYTHLTLPTKIGV